MISDLANHVWQSTVFAAAVAVLVFVVRQNHARVRYWLWCTASLKFFIPFALLTSLGSRAELPHVAQTQLSAAVATAVTQIQEPFSDHVFVAATSAPPVPAGDGGAWRSALLAIWALGVGAVVLMRLRQWWRVRRLVRTSVPVTLIGVDLPPGVHGRSTSGMLEPAIVGIFRPMLLLPAGIQEYLTRRQLQAVIAHELCHVRHRDNLIAAMHMLVEAVFWFHPLVWWIGGRLVDARERACDEDVLRELGDPGEYAEGILKVCRRYVEASLVCVSGISGADLRVRVEAIVANRIGSRLKATKALVLIAAASLAILVPVTVGAVAASQRAAAFVPTVLADVGLIAPAPAQASAPQLPSAAVAGATPTRAVTSALAPAEQQPPTPVGPAPTPPPGSAASAPQPLNGQDVRVTGLVMPGTQAQNSPARDIAKSPGTVTLGDRNFARSDSAVDSALERRLEEALKSGNAVDRLFVTLDASYRQLNSAEYQISATVHIAPPLMTVGSDPLRLEFVGAIQDAPYAITQARTAEAFELALDADARSALATTPIVYQRAFVLLPGRYRIRFLVRDQATDRIGVVDVPFYVPNLNRIKRAAQ